MRLSFLATFHRSFQDVIDQGYKVVAYEDGMDDLINAAPGSAMEDVYKNHMLGPGYDDKYEAISEVLNKYREGPESVKKTLVENLSSGPL